MVSINYAFREIHCKIVFYGPGLSGKTTNLQYIHKKVPPNTKGELISLATDADRTLYFDFLPINIGSVAGFTTKFQLYTVPGQVYYNATRKLVLRGADGLVFVADSQAEKADENIESLRNLYENLCEYGYEPEEIPMVFQYNKRDLPGAVPLEQLEQALNPKRLPSFEAVATKGIGVFDTLKCVTKLVLDKARRQTEKNSEVTQTDMPAAVEKQVTPAVPAAGPGSSVQPRTLEEPVGVGAPVAATMFKAESVAARAPVLPHRPRPGGAPEPVIGRLYPERFSGNSSGPIAPVRRPDSSADPVGKPVLTPAQLVASRPRLRPLPPKKKKKSFWSRLFSLGR